MAIHLLKEKREEKKAKALLDEAYERYGETNEVDEQVPRIRPRTRGLKRALELERQKDVELANKLTLNEQFAIIFNENWEQCLDRYNQHLEKLLKKENRDNDILRNRAKKYAKKNKTARPKLKRANAKIEALTMKEEEKRLDILNEA